MRTISVVFLLVLVAGADLPVGYRLQKTIPVPGDGGWDYLVVDDAARRVYIAHATQVVVLDADSGAVRGTIADLKGTHGIAVAADLGRGFISDGKANAVVVFDLKTLQRIGTVATGTNPDAIVYEPISRRILAFNAGSASATVIDATTAKATATLELAGQPEFATTDGTGHVFVNLMDKSELLKLAVRQPAVLERWPLAPGETPASLAIDRTNRRLFVGCRNKKLVVVNADSGKVVSTVPLGERVDATAYDRDLGLVLSANGEGTVTVVRQEGPDKYAVVETVKTRPGSRTLALDPKTHRMFVPAAEFKAAAATTPGVPVPRPQMVPGSFVVLIFGQAAL